MKYQSFKDEAFLVRVAELLGSEGEALVLFRYARAAGKRFLVHQHYGSVSLGGGIVAS
jgi:hypothetical protein